MNKLFVGLVVVYGLLVAGSAEASAQVTRSDSIVDFMETFLSGFVFSGEERPTIRVADLPSRRAAGLELPPDASIAGSVEFPSLSFTILRSTDPAETLSTLRRTLEAAGWIIHRPPGDAQLEAASEGYTYCREDQSLGLSAQQNHGKVTIFHMTDEEMSPCSMPDHVQHGRTAPPIPELEPPHGVRPRGGSSSGSDDRWSKGIELNGEISLDDTAAHYVDQLRVHGAEVSEIIETQGLRLARIRMTEDNGVAWTGTLTVLGEAESNVRHIQIYVVKQETR